MSQPNFLSEKGVPTFLTSHPEYHAFVQEVFWNTTRRGEYSKLTPIELADEFNTWLKSKSRDFLNKMNQVGSIVSFPVEETDQRDNLHLKSRGWWYGEIVTIDDACSKCRVRILENQYLRDEDPIEYTDIYAEMAVDSVCPFKNLASPDQPYARKAPHIPTLEELNDMSYSLVALLMARTLVTSDLAFTYMVLKDDTVADLIKYLKSSRKGHGTFVDPIMTDDQLQEFDGYILQLENHVEQSRKRRAN